MTYSGMWYQQRSAPLLPRNASGKSAIFLYFDVYQPLLFNKEIFCFNLQTQRFPLQETLLGRKVKRSVTCRKSAEKKVSPEEFPGHLKPIISIPIKKHARYNQ